jgi:alkylhydroperoxidase/carboxymuconolactone decarboxylase family protein YurZ
MPDRFRAHFDELMQAPLRAKGELSQEVRQAILADLGAPRELRAFARKVAIRAHSITHKDIEEVLAAGFSEDEVFETIVTAALHASKARLDKALSLLEDD